MAPKMLDAKEMERWAFEAELADLQLAIEVNLPPEAILQVGGDPAERSEILAMLEGCRLACANPEAMQREMVRCPYLASEMRRYARDVRLALARHLDAEAREGFDSTAGRRVEEKTGRRILAAAKRAPTREIRGIHLRRRSGKIPGGRFPWVE